MTSGITSWTYGRLKAAVAQWMHRADMAGQIPDMIELAEANIRRDVRCRDMERTTSGQVTNRQIVLPDRLVEVRRLLLDGVAQEYLPPGRWSEQQFATTQRYTIIGATAHVQPVAAEYVLDYWEAMPSLVDDGDTNWVLTNAPDIYLYASLEQAGIYTLHDQMAAIGRAQYENAKRRLQDSEQRARFGGALRVVGEQVV